MRNKQGARAHQKRGGYSALIETLAALAPQGEVFFL